MTPKPRHLIAATPTLASADSAVGHRRALAYLRAAETAANRAAEQASETRIKIAARASERPKQNVG